MLTKKTFLCQSVLSALGSIKYAKKGAYLGVEWQNLIWQPASEGSLALGFNFTKNNCFSTCCKSGAITELKWFSPLSFNEVITKVALFYEDKEIAQLIVWVEGGCGGVVCTEVVSLLYFETWPLKALSSTPLGKPRNWFWTDFNYPHNFAFCKKEHRGSISSCTYSLEVLILFSVTWHMARDIRVFTFFIAR